MEKVKIHHFSIIILLSFATLDLSTAALEDQLLTSERKIKEKPIVIHTQAKNYNQPTLDEYHQCHENLDICYKVCESALDRKACEAECPTCPILIDHDVVIQGVNDTNLRVPVEPPVNTTNVIKLTNVIRNVIENRMGNVTALNENNISVHNNVSTTGGRFGLGYNEKGSCCLVIRSSKNCNSPKFSTGSRCHNKRLRVCGERCKARVMYAKRVKYCNDDQASNCYSRMSYLPYRKHHASRCHFQPVWPFVACGSEEPFMSSCQRCLKLSYGYILSNGVPTGCVPCYRGTSSYGSTYAVDPDPTYLNWDDAFTPEGDDWRIVKKKCRQLDGAIVNCDGNNDLGSSGLEDGFVDRPFEEDPFDPLVDPNDDHSSDMYGNDYTDQTYDNELDEWQTERRRRQTILYSRPTFQRSAYSRRNRPKIID